MKPRNILLALLACGALSAGCAAFTPGEVQQGVATAHQNIVAIRSSIAWVVSQSALADKILRNVDAIAANVSSMDTLLNK